ncbi:MAG TPA: phosphoribosylanthranilate isomerase [Chthonomonadaceae bacterium]|nr:phosphoribosylanthranilate isomerase [Chthonomonadaceae bacterium]
MSTRVKICGITNAEDAIAAIGCGADALGFIRVSGSPRYVSAEHSAKIAAALPPFVSRVGVMRDLSNAAESDARAFDAHQYYADAGAARSVEGARIRRIRCYRIAAASELDEIAETCAGCDAILLDTYHEAVLGGSGETFDWAIAAEARRRFDLPLILAGGLTPDNVGEAIRRVRPYAVDVSTGVEAEPGRKDHAKLRAFVQAVRRADAAER